MMTDTLNGALRVFCPRSVDNDDVDNLLTTTFATTTHQLHDDFRRGERGCGPADVEILPSVTAPETCVPNSK